MSSEEKRAWIDAGVAVGVAVVYAVVVLVRLSGSDAAGVSYAGPMLTAVGVAIAAGIVLNVLTAVARPADAGRKDERDQQINRLGNSVGFFVMSIGAVLPLGLAMARVEHFWIAQALYLCFVLAALVSATAKILAYRRGI